MKVFHRLHRVKGIVGIVAIVLRVKKNATAHYKEK